MIEIAMQKDGHGTLQKDIASKQEISEKYLDPIIAGLKAAGLIINTGGRKSGYKIAKPADNITVYDVFRAFEMPLSIVPCILNNELCYKSNCCVAMDYWSDFNNHMIQHLQSTTVKQLVQKEIIISHNPDHKDCKEA
jgi:Rrf2 family protein